MYVQCNILFHKNHKKVNGLLSDHLNTPIYIMSYNGTPFCILREGFLH